MVVSAEPLQSLKFEFPRRKPDTDGFPASMPRVTSLALTDPEHSLDCMLQDANDSNIDEVCVGVAEWGGDYGSFCDSIKLCATCPIWLR